MARRFAYGKFGVIFAHLNEKKILKKEMFTFKKEN